jgi:hypothetical protein
MILSMAIRSNSEHLNTPVRRASIQEPDALTEVEVDMPEDPTDFARVGPLDIEADHYFKPIRPFLYSLFIRALRFVGI